MRLVMWQRPESIEMGELTPEDWDIIYETEDEFQVRSSVDMPI